MICSKEINDGSAANQENYKTQCASEMFQVNVGGLFYFLGIRFTAFTAPRNGAPQRILVMMPKLWLTFAINYCYLS